MSAPLVAGLPPDLDLDGGYTLRFDAVDPATGATVSGVTVSAVASGATDLAGNLTGLLNVANPVLVRTSP